MAKTIALPDFTDCGFAVKRVLAHSLTRGNILSVSGEVLLPTGRESDVRAPPFSSLVPQMQVTLSARQHVLVSAGVRIPVNEREGRSPTVITYLLWDWFDGGFLTGWPLASGGDARSRADQPSRNAAS